MKYVPVPVALAPGLLRRSDRLKARKGFAQDVDEFCSSIAIELNRLAGFAEKLPFI